MTDSATKTASRFQSQLRGDPKTKGPTQKLKCATQEPECTIQQPKLPKQKCHIFSITRHQIRAPPLYNRVHLGHHKRSAPPPPLNIMLHQNHKTLTLPPLLNNTLHHKIEIPPLPLNNTLHLEHRKTSITPFIRTLYCILSSTRHQIRLPPLNNTLHLEHYKTSSPHIPATPSEHSVASSGSQDSSPGTPSEQYTLRHQPRHPL